MAGPARGGSSTVRNRWPHAPPEPRDGAGQESGSVAMFETGSGQLVQIFQQGEGGRKKPPRRNPWGNSSYADLITQAIETSSEKKLTLSQIYDWMVRNVPHFGNQGTCNSSAGWKNSIRHNLSLHKKFLRIKNESSTGKSSWWTIDNTQNSGKTTRRKNVYRRKRSKTHLPKPQPIYEKLPNMVNNQLRNNLSGASFTNQIPLANFHWRGFEPPFKSPEKTWHSTSSVSDDVSLLSSCSGDGAWSSENNRMFIQSNQSNAQMDSAKVPNFNYKHSDSFQNFPSCAYSKFYCDNQNIVNNTDIDNFNFNLQNNQYTDYTPMISQQYNAEVIRRNTSSEYFSCPHHLSGSYIMSNDKSVLESHNFAANSDLEQFRNTICANKSERYNIESKTENIENAHQTGLTECTEAQRQLQLSTHLQTVEKLKNHMRLKAEVLDNERENISSLMPASNHSNVLTEESYELDDSNCSTTNQNSCYFSSEGVIKNDSEENFTQTEKNGAEKVLYIDIKQELEDENSQFNEEYFGDMDQSSSNNLDSFEKSFSCNRSVSSNPILFNISPSNDILDKNIEENEFSKCHMDNSGINLDKKFQTVVNFNSKLPVDDVNEKLTGAENILKPVIEDILMNRLHDNKTSQLECEAEDSSKATYFLKKIVMLIVAKSCSFSFSANSIGILLQKISSLCDNLNLNGVTSLLLQTLRYLTRINKSTDQENQNSCNEQTHTTVNDMLKYLDVVRMNICLDDTNADESNEAADSSSSIDCVLTEIDEKISSQIAEETCSVNALSLTNQQVISQSDSNYESEKEMDDSERSEFLSSKYTDINNNELQVTSEYECQYNSYTKLTKKNPLKYDADIHWAQKVFQSETGESFKSEETVLPDDLNDIEISGLLNIPYDVTSIDFLYDHCDMEFDQYLHIDKRLH